MVEAFLTELVKIVQGSI